MITGPTLAQHSLPPALITALLCSPTGNPPQLKSVWWWGWVPIVLLSAHTFYAQERETEPLFTQSLKTKVIPIQQDMHCPISTGKITTKKSFLHSAPPSLPPSLSSAPLPFQESPLGSLSALHDPGHPHHFFPDLPTLSALPRVQISAGSLASGQLSLEIRENLLEKLMCPITAACIFIRTNLLRSGEAVPAGSFSRQVYCLHLVSEIKAASLLERGDSSRGFSSSGTAQVQKVPVTLRLLLSDFRRGRGVEAQELASCLVMSPEPLASLLCTQGHCILPGSCSGPGKQ